MANPYPANFEDQDGVVRLQGQVDFTDSGNQPGGSSSLLTGYGPPVNGTNETVELTGNPGSGTLTLTFRAETTDPIQWNATVGDVVAALEALSTIGANNVRPNPPDSTRTLPDNGYMDIDFVGDLGSQVVESPTLTNSTDDPTLAIAEYQAGAEPTPSGARAGAHYLDLEPVLLATQWCQVEYLYLDNQNTGPEWVAVWPATRLGIPDSTGLGANVLNLAQDGGYDGAVTDADGSTLIANYYLDTAKSGDATGTSFVWNGYDETGQKRFDITTQSRLSGDNGQSLKLATRRSDGTHEVTFTLRDDGIFVTGLPTDPSGLPAGSLYSDSGTIKIVLP